MSIPIGTYSTEEYKNHNSLVVEKSEGLLGLQGTRPSPPKDKVSFKVYRWNYCL